MEEYLMKARKQQLLQLADDVEVVAETSWKKIRIVREIMATPGFNAGMVRAALEGILEEEREAVAEEREAARKAEEREAARKAEEREAARRAEEREAARKAEEREAAREAAEEKERERQFVLEKMRLENESTLRTSTPQPTERQTKVVVPEIRKVMPKFDPGSSDVSQFLSLFERQVKLAQIEPEMWTSQLLSLLPIDVGHVILREAADDLPDYETAKQTLLDRYRLTAEAFRGKFLQHRKKGDVRWRDFAYEVANYFDNWLKGLEVSTFEKLRDLMITEQIKKGASADMRAHFADSWSAEVSPLTLAEKLDKYEINRPNLKRGTLPSKEWRSEKELGTVQKNRDHGEITGKAGEQGKESEEGLADFKRSPKKNFPRREFEKRKPALCFVCSSDKHFRRDCPFKENNNSNEVERINNIATEDDSERNFEPFMWEAKINGVPAKILRDSGASYDLVPKNLVRAEDQTGRTVLVRQPLDRRPHRLPVARIEILGPCGEIHTEAAVTEGLSYYLLGNKTAMKIREAEVLMQKPRTPETRTRGQATGRQNADEVPRAEIGDTRKAGEQIVEPPPPVRTEYEPFPPRKSKGQERDSGFPPSEVLAPKEQGTQTENVEGRRNREKMEERGSVVPLSGVIRRGECAEKEEIDATPQRIPESATHAELLTGGISAQRESRNPRSEKNSLSFRVKEMRNAGCDNCRRRKLLRRDFCSGNARRYYDRGPRRPTGIQFREWCTKRRLWQKQAFGSPSREPFKENKDDPFPRNTGSGPGEIVLSLPPETARKKMNVT